MGRKNRKKIFDRIENEEQFEESDEEYNNEEQKEREYEKIMKITEIREKMINYVRNNNLPLCENLTFDLMVDFVKWAQS